MPAKRSPSKGKRFVKVVKNKKTGRTKKVSYGQAGKSKSGKDRIQPGSKKGDSYCARIVSKKTKRPEHPKQSVTKEMAMSG
jgi:hypothetical protein